MTQTNKPHEMSLILASLKAYLASLGVNDLQPESRSDTTGLLTIAKKFSSMALETYNKELLTRALMLAKAIAEFEEELTRPS